MRTTIAFLLLCSPAFADSTIILPAKPNTGNQPVFDLSPVATVPISRAVLRPVLAAPTPQNLGGDKVMFSGNSLLTTGPRHVAYDAEPSTVGRDKFPVVQFDCRGFSPPAKWRLEITSSLPSKPGHPVVTGARAFHRAGQTFVTWSEPTNPLSTGAVGQARYDATAKTLANTTYRIYRHTAEITPLNIRQAVLIDEVPSLTCWGRDRFGKAAQPGVVLPTFAVEDGHPLEPGKGVYCHNPDRPGTHWYAISVVVDGAEQLDTINAGNVTGEVQETVGDGPFVLQKREVGPFNFSSFPATREYYVRWESYPRSHVPSFPVWYLAVFPQGAVKGAPVEVGLHCWSGSVDSCWCWWYQPERRVLLTVDQTRYDWWTGHPRQLESVRTWAGATIEPFDARRVAGWLEYGLERWELDRTRVLMSGQSMGSGNVFFSLRNPTKVSHSMSWVGIRTPAKSDWFRPSFEAVWGPVGLGLKFSDTDRSVWDYYDDTQFVTETSDVPWLVMAHGKNDDKIGWQQALAFADRLQATRQPHCWQWGWDGHQQRALWPGPKPSEKICWMDLRADQSLPAFSQCSLDDDPVMVNRGQRNLWIYWRSESIVDTVDRWSCEVRLSDNAPVATATVNVTPRRCRNFVGVKTVGVTVRRDAWVRVEVVR